MYRVNDTAGADVHLENKHLFNEPGKTDANQGGAAHSATEDRDQTAAGEAEGAIENERPLSNDETAEYEKELVKIASIFDNIALPYIDRASQALKYVELFEKLTSRHDVVKPTIGRPGVIRKVVRVLAVPGKTEAAQRKWLERALQIAGMSSTVLSAAMEAKVAQHQSTLLDIARAGTDEEQLEKIKQITARKAQQKGSRTGPKLCKAQVRFSEDRKDEVLALLAKFADENGIELLPSV